MKDPAFPKRLTSLAWNGQGFLEVFDAIIKDVEATLGNDYSPLTLKQYRTVRKRFAEFLQKREKRKDIPVAAFNFKLIKSFDVYLKGTYSAEI